MIPELTDIVLGPIKFAFRLSHFLIGLLGAAVLAAITFYYINLLAAAIVGGLAVASLLAYTIKPLWDMVQPHTNAGWATAGVGVGAFSYFSHALALALPFSLPFVWLAPVIFSTALLLGIRLAEGLYRVMNPKVDKQSPYVNYVPTASTRPQPPQPGPQPQPGEQQQARPVDWYTKKNLHIP